MFNKRKIRIVGIIIGVLAIVCCSACRAYAESVEELKQQIAENETQMLQLEDMKSQLHSLAELLRANDYINNELDTHLSLKWHECNDYQLKKSNENDEIEQKIKEIENKPKKKYVGNFKITHYCPCYTCNGSWGSKTALGTTMTPNRTIAVDPRVIPLGSKVEINGKTYIAEDTGGAIKGNRIDMCVSSHSEAYARGVLNSVPVYIVSD